MKLTVQFFVLVGMLFVGVMWGINMADNGIQRIQGNPHPSAQAFQIKKISGGKMEMEVLGRQISSESQLLKGHPENWLTDTGTGLRSWFVVSTRKGLEWLMKKL
jgi:hypothetical protein